MYVCPSLTLHLLVNVARALIIGEHNFCLYTLYLNVKMVDHFEFVQVEFSQGISLSETGNFVLG